MLSLRLVSLFSFTGLALGLWQTACTSGNPLVRSHDEATQASSSGNASCGDWQEPNCGGLIKLLTNDTGWQAPAAVTFLARGGVTQPFGDKKGSGNQFPVPRGFSSVVAVKELPGVLVASNDLTLLLSRDGGCSWQPFEKDVYDPALYSEVNLPLKLAAVGQHRVVAWTTSYTKPLTMLSDDEVRALMPPGALKKLKLTSDKLLQYRSLLFVIDVNDAKPLVTPVRYPDSADPGIIMSVAAGNCLSQQCTPELVIRYGTSTGEVFEQHADTTWTTKRLVHVGQRSDLETQESDPNSDDDDDDEDHRTVRSFHPAAILGQVQRYSFAPGGGGAAVAAGVLYRYFEVADSDTSLELIAARLHDDDLPRTNVDPDDFEFWDIARSALEPNVLWALGVYRNQNHPEAIVLFESHDSGETYVVVYDQELPAWFESGKNTMLPAIAPHPKNRNVVFYSVGDNHVHRVTSLSGDSLHVDTYAVPLSVIPSASGIMFLALSPVAAAGSDDNAGLPLYLGLGQVPGF